MLQRYAAHAVHARMYAPMHTLFRLRPSAYMCHHYTPCKPWTKDVQIQAATTADPPKHVYGRKGGG